MAGHGPHMESLMEQGVPGSMINLWAVSVSSHSIYWKGGAATAAEYKGFVPSRDSPRTVGIKAQQKDL